MELIRKTTVVDKDGLERAMMRMAHQVIEKNRTLDDVCLIGVKTRGVYLAAMLEKNIRSITGRALPTGELDITMHRDDIQSPSDAPILNSSDIPFSVEGKTVILVDDVIFTGRTARAAMDAVMDLGRAARIQLLVMIDRGHRELPIRADYVGKNIPTSRAEVVSVKLDEPDGETGVWLCEKR